ncbi:MAG: methyltransferase protein [Caulobacteraceae bacterium]|nr:methyltransferase protein [Caulobacteraceae bacterium]
MPDFASRAHTPELMDGDDVDFETFHGCLADLAKVNRLTLAYRPTLAFLNRLRREGRWPADRPLEILDVGSGYGDMLRVIRRWAARRGLAVRLTGLDRNPWSQRSAEQARGSAGIRWLTEDLFDHQGGTDVVLSSLFTHHLDDASLIRFVEWQETNARIGWFVNDLLRHPFSYHGFTLLARLMRWHPFVQHDGPVSISRAFSRRDWTEVLVKAGARHARIEPWFPFRLCVSRVRG